MVTIHRPSEAAITALLAAARDSFSYPEVGAASELGAPLPPSLGARYDVDHRQFVLGKGRALFDRARECLFAWRHLEIPWLSFHGATASVHRGQVVASLARVLGLWFLSPCQVVFSHFESESPRLAGFGYGTLQGHVERGEERFVLSFDPDDELVRYEIAAFSRPANLLTRLGYPLARRLQSRFATSSAEALARAAAAERPDSRGSLG